MLSVTCNNMFVRFLIPHLTIPCRALELRQFVHQAFLFRWIDRCVRLLELVVDFSRKSAVFFHTPDRSPEPLPEAKAYLSRVILEIAVAYILTHREI